MTKFNQVFHGVPFIAATLLEALITSHWTVAMATSLVKEGIHSILILSVLNAWSGNSQKSRWFMAPWLPLQPVSIGLYLEDTALSQHEYSHCSLQSDPDFFQATLWQNHDTDIGKVSWKGIDLGGVCLSFGVSVPSHWNSQPANPGINLTDSGSGTKVNRVC